MSENFSGLSLRQRIAKNAWWFLSHPLYALHWAIYKKPYSCKCWQHHERAA
jgi:hypothetical protein